MKLQQQLFEKVKLNHLSLKSYKSYWRNIEKFLRFHKEKQGRWVHPRDMAEPEVEEYLTYLAVKKNVSANTQNQHFAAICYLYRKLLDRPLENVSSMRAKKPKQIIECLDRHEIRDLLIQTQGVPRLFASMMYASGFRIGEVCRIRIKDIKFHRNEIDVRGGKGNKDRTVGFPSIIHGLVNQQIESAKEIWQQDIDQGLKGVSLPNAWGRKSPQSHMEFGWWYLFPSVNYSMSPLTGEYLRHHRDAKNVAKQLRKAWKRTGHFTRFKPHGLRHSFATHSLENGVPIHVIKNAMGHANMETTKEYLHLCKQGVSEARSPLMDIVEDEPTQSQQSKQPPLIKLYAG